MTAQLALFPFTTECLDCGATIIQCRGGRLRKFCDKACYRRHYQRVTYADQTKAQRRRCRKKHQAYSHANSGLFRTVVLRLGYEREPFSVAAASVLLDRVLPSIVHERMAVGAVKNWMRARLVMAKKRYMEARGILHPSTLRRRQNRKEAIGILGGRCCECGETDLEVLQIDHIEPRALAKPGEKRTETGYAIVTEILKDPDAARSKYQALCANHHMKKTLRDQRRLRLVQQGRRVLQ